MKLTCQNSKICSACPWIEFDLTEQQARKQQHFLSHLQTKTQINIRSLTAESSIEQFRDRSDLTISDGNIGFYRKRELEPGIFDLKQCPLMSPSLNELYQLIRSYSWSMKKASLRIRVSPEGHKGLWLDTSHLDTKYLLDEQSILLDLLNKNIHIEIGQRRKTLTYDCNRLRLTDPKPRHWTRTWKKSSSNSELEPIMLLSLIGSFSQTGDQMNKLIIQAIHELLENQTGNWLEFGCGSGNLSLPLSQYGHVLAYDNDRLAIESLSQTIIEYKLEGQIQTNHKDLQKENFQIPDLVDSILVNPARNGVGALFKQITEKVRQVVYMSCYPESFFKDIQSLKDQGFELKKVILVDQFPHTEHYEILSRWERRPTRT